MSMRRVRSGLKRGILPNFDGFAYAEDHGQLTNGNVYLQDANGNLLQCLDRGEERAEASVGGSIQPI